MIERNNSGNRYGYDEEKLHAKIRSHGFSPCSYNPFKRQLQPLKEGFGNIIYIRDIKSAGERLAAAKPFELGSLKV